MAPLPRKKHICVVQCLARDIFCLKEIIRGLRISISIIQTLFFFYKNKARGENMSFLLRVLKDDNNDDAVSDSLCTACVVRTLDSAITLQMISDYKHKVFLQPSPQHALFCFSFEEVLKERPMSSALVCLSKTSKAIYVCL